MVYGHCSEYQPGYMSRWMGELIDDNFSSQNHCYIIQYNISVFTLSMFKISSIVYLYKWILISESQSPRMCTLLYVLCQSTSNIVQNKSTAEWILAVYYFITLYLE